MLIPGRYTYYRQTWRSTSSHMPYVQCGVNRRSYFPVGVWYVLNNQRTLRDHNPSAQLRCPVSCRLPHGSRISYSPASHSERVAAACNPLSWVVTLEAKPSRQKTNSRLPGRYYICLRVELTTILRRDLKSKAIRVTKHVHCFERSYLQFQTQLTDEAHTCLAEMYQPQTRMKSKYVR